MLNRSYAIVQLVDYLENQGFRVCVVAYNSDVADLGAYKDKHIDLLHVEVVVKSGHEGHLIKVFCHLYITLVFACPFI